MGNTASGEAGAAASSALSSSSATNASFHTLGQAVFSLLADPATAHALRQLSERMKEGPQLVAGPNQRINTLIDTSSPILAPVLAALCTNDKALEETAKALVGKRYADKDSFWTSYLSRALELVPATAQTTTSAAVPFVASKTVSNENKEKSEQDEGTSQSTIEGKDKKPPHEVAPKPAEQSRSDNGKQDEQEEDDDEEVLLTTIHECFIYRLPPRTRAQGYVASSWGLEKPAVIGYCRVVAVGEKEISIALWQRPDQMSLLQPSGSSGSSAPSALSSSSSVASASVSLAPAASGHKLVAVCRIPLLDRIASAAKAKTAFSASSSLSAASVLVEQPLDFYLEPTVDSSRYYALRVSQQRGATAVLGIGFRERQSSFDLRSSLDDHLARVARQRGLSLSLSLLMTGPRAGAGLGPHGEADSSAVSAASLLLEQQLQGLTLSALPFVSATGGTTGSVGGSGATTSIKLDLSHLKGLPATTATTERTTTTTAASAATGALSQGGKLGKPRAFAPAAAVLTSVPAPSAAASPVKSAKHQQQVEAEGVQSKDGDFTDEDWGDFEDAAADAAFASVGAGSVSMAGVEEVKGKEGTAE